MIRSAARAYGHDPYTCGDRVRYHPEVWWSAGFGRHPQLEARGRQSRVVGERFCSLYIAFEEGGEVAGRDDVDGLQDVLLFISAAGAVVAGRSRLIEPVVHQA